MKHPFPIILISLVALVSCHRESLEQRMVAEPLEATVMTQADQYLTYSPITVTAFVAERSSGGIHDFFSEGDLFAALKQEKIPLI